MLFNKPISTFLMAVLLLTVLPSAYGQKMFFLAAGSVTDPKNGNCIADGVASFTKLIQENVPPDRLEIYNASSARWKGPDLANSQQLSVDLPSAIRNCPATEKDTILVFWFGPRGIDSRDFTLLLDPENKKEKISRTDLSRLLQAKQVHLACLITESSRLFHKTSRSRKQLGAPNTRQVSNIMNDLFFKSSGLVDINSTATNQYSLIMPESGSAMLEAFRELIECHDYKDFNWSDFVTETNEEIQEIFKKHRQTIHVFALPDDITEKKQPTKTNWQNKWDTYAQHYDNFHRQGEVSPYPQNYSYAQPNKYAETDLGGWSSPVYHPEAGDLLLGINGIRIANYEQFIDAIQRSPNIIYLTFLDQRYGEIYELRTFLGPAGRQIRLGLSVVNDNFGAVRVTGSALGSPATRCQYRYGYYERRGNPYQPIPDPVPAPDPVPGPIPDPVPAPDPIPGPIPDPVPAPDPIPGPIPDPVPAPDPIPGPDSMPDNVF